MISFEQIDKVICEYFQMSSDELHHKTRKKEIIEARQYSHYFAIKLTKYNYASIGKYFGNLDASTISHSLKTITRLGEVDNQAKMIINELKELFDVIIEGNKRRLEQQMNLNKANTVISLIDEMPLIESVRLLNHITQKILDKYDKSINHRKLPVTS